MKAGKGRIMLKNCFVSVSVPLAVFIIFQMICKLCGVAYINSDNFRSFIVNTFYVAFIGWGLYFNVPSGRFDFSVGAVILLAPIIGGNIALMLGLDAVGMLICCILIGAFLGAVSGLAYILLKLPAMVASLGVALIYEAFTFILFNAKGVVLIGMSKMLYIIRTPYIYILGAITLAILIVVVNFTKFGYNLRALAKGQSISVNTGINEKTNAVLCYTLCGALSAVAGVMTLSRTGNASASLGLTTIMTMFQGFLPMFIGGILDRYSEPITGILIGALVSSLIASGFAALGLPLAAQNIINAFILLGFLVFAMNQGKFEEFALIRERKKKILQKYHAG